MSKFIGLTGAKIIKEKLVEYGVKNITAYSGGAIMGLLDEFHSTKNDNINYYVHTHEQNCGHASTGYAKSSGKLGVSIVTSGPGLTNMLTPMLDSTNDSTSLMVISGQVPTESIGSLAFQECPAVELSKNVTKFSYQFKSVEDIPYILDKAYYLAMNGKRGSVHLDVPKNVLNEIYTKEMFDKNKVFDEKIYKNVRKNFFMNKYKDCTDKKYLNEIFEIIKKSKRPILYLGQGSKGLEKEIEKLLIISNLPVTTTIHGLGIIDQKIGNSLKWLGMHGYAPANLAVYYSDCIICVGARFDDRTTGNINKYGKYAKNIIHVNIEESEIRKNVNSNYNVVCSAGKFIEEMYNKFNLCDLNSHMSYKEWWYQIKVWKDKYPFEYNEDDSIKTPDIIKEINKNLDDNKEYIFTTGVGNHQMQTAQYIDWSYNKKFLSSGSLGVMGVGIPYGIGAKIANPDKEVIVIDGDSSALMTLTDLKTVKENNIGIKIFILNNETQGMVEVWEKLFFEGRITATKNENNPSFYEVGKSFGINSYYCDDKEDLADTIEIVMMEEGPVLCEIKCENEICLPLVKPGSGLNDMLLYGYEEGEINFDVQNCPS